MHLATRGYLFVLLTAVLAIAAVWSGTGGYGSWWHVPCGLLLLGLTFEHLYVRRRPLELRIQTAPRAFLGRAQPAQFLFVNRAARALQVEYAPLTPPGFDALTGTRRVRVPPLGTIADAVTLVPVRLGTQQWPPVAARVLGPYALAWWSTGLSAAPPLVIAPDSRSAAARPRGMERGVRLRRVAGAGAELHQLRAYTPGDPLARIDWKATARLGALITREYSEDQHLDVLIAIDAGRLSRVRCGQLDRLGLYSNLATRFAEIATRHDDRVGFVIYAERVLASCPPARGLAAVVRLRGALERLSVQLAESDPTVAAVSIRSLLQHRALVLLLTDLDDANVADQLMRAVRLLSPPHLVVVAGALNGEIAALARQEARDWLDPWIALAASEHEVRAEAQRRLLRLTGAPVVAAPPERLEEAVFERYETLRRARRI